MLIYIYCHVDKCPRKHLNSKSLLIILTFNKMCFLKCVDVNGRFDVVMVNTTLPTPYKHI